MPIERPLHLPEHETPAALPEVLQALRDQGLKPVHDKKSWGDWISLKPYETVISIDSQRGLTRNATLEIEEAEEDELELKLIEAFRTLGWWGIDEDGEYQL